MNKARMNQVNQQPIIVHISPDRTVKGGISSVVTNIAGSKLAEKYRLIFISSHIDGSKIQKFFQACVGALHTLIVLSTMPVSIVHLHSGDLPSPNRKFFFYKLSKIYRKKIVFHFHGADFISQVKKAAPFWRRKIIEVFQGADRVICLSHAWETAIRQFADQSSITVLPNAVKIPAAPKRCEPKGRVGLTFLGLVGERKGIFDLLLAMERIVKQHRNVVLRIGGNGDIRRLLREVHRANLDRHVEYLGWLRGEAKEDLLCNTDIFVLPSYAEGMPVSILEAFSYNIPVVSTTVGGIPEVVKDAETGFLIAPGDLDKLIDRITLLITDAGLRNRLGQSAGRLVREKYNIESYCSQLDRIYSELMAAAQLKTNIS